MKKGPFVYKNTECMEKMHRFYDKALKSLHIEYSEEYIDTSFGKTHILTAGDKNKPPLCTIHGGNGITPLNLKLFIPLLNEYRIIAPDVVGMPGKSEPYRTVSSKKDEYGLWICELLNALQIEKLPFVVSSYSSAMLLSLAKAFPDKIDKAVLLVPSGIAHGPIMPMLTKMVVPFISYYFAPDKKTLDKVMDVMGGKGDDLWHEFFDVMMSSYKMEMRPPKEYHKKELCRFKAPLLIIASNSDIFFPADKVFKKAVGLFAGRVKTELIESKHLPSEAVMKKVCEQVAGFFKNEEQGNAI